MTPSAPTPPGGHEVDIVATLFSDPITILLYGVALVGVALLVYSEYRD